MREVNIFAASGDEFRAQTEVEQEVNQWLKEHPQAIILVSHTNMTIRPTEYSHTFITNFTLTLIVELPEES